jgi:CheY-like chemotaxis protein
MKHKILVLGGDATVKRMKDSLRSSDLDVVYMLSLPDNVGSLKGERFGVALVDYDVEELPGVCFRLLWIGRMRVAVLIQNRSGDQPELSGIGVEGFLNAGAGPGELAAGLSGIAARGAPVFKPVKLLVIEDDKFIRESIRVSFKIFWPEAETTFADDGRSGLDIARSYGPDLVLLDLGLPDITGYEVLQRLKAVCRAPVIILSANREKINIVQAIQAGAVDYIVKPFKQIELLPRIKKQVG